MGQVLCMNQTVSSVRCGGATVELMLSRQAVHQFHLLHLTIRTPTNHMQRQLLLPEKRRVVRPAFLFACLALLSAGAPAFGEPLPCPQNAPPPQADFGEWQPSLGVTNMGGLIPRPHHQCSVSFSLRARTAPSWRTRPSFHKPPIRNGTLPWMTLTGFACYPADVE